MFKRKRPVKQEAFYYEFSTTVKNLERFLVVQEIFKQYREDNAGKMPNVMVYPAKTSYLPGGPVDMLLVWIDTSAPALLKVDGYRKFILGIDAALTYYDPMGDKDD